MLKKLFLPTLLIGLLWSPSWAQQETFLLVSSRNTNSVRMYDAASGEYIRDWAPPGIGGLDRTQEVIYGPDGNVYVSGIGTPVVLKFDGKTGEYLGPFTTGYELDSPTKISWGPDGHMYVSQWGNNEGRRNVVRFNAETGEFVDEFTHDNPPGACDQEWDDDGNMYLASFGLKRVLKYAPDGSRIGSFTSAQPGHGPVDLYWALNGDLMVVDWDNGRVNAYDAETGAFKNTFISGMTNTEGITIGPDGRIYAADWTENRINSYSPLTGQGGAAFIGPEGGLKAPNALIFGPQEPVHTATEETPEPMNFLIEPNYPDPFGTKTTIPLKAVTPLRLDMRIFDVQGRLVLHPVERMYPPGRHLIGVDAEQLPDGHYVYTFTGNGRSASGVMTKN